MTLRRGTCAALVVVGLGVTACGSATEKLAETAIEQGTGGDVDLDISGDGGSFSVDTPEGKVSFETDGDGQASYTFEGDDASSSYEVTGELPDNWPDFVFVPEMELYGASQQQQGSLRRFAANGVRAEATLLEVVDEIVAAMGAPPGESINEPSATLVYEERGFSIEYLIFETAAGVATIDITASETA